MSMEKLTQMQRELMDKVPHSVGARNYTKMTQGVNLISNVLLYLNSCGHKPWRPKPLGKNKQLEKLADINTSYSTLKVIHELEDSAFKGQPPELFSRMVVSGLGIIEETVEYLVSVQAKKPRPEQLEEITDVLFFYLEQVILGGFSWQEIEEEYIRKHAVNLDRYKRAKEGDYSWNHRDKGEL